MQFYTTAAALGFAALAAANPAPQVSAQISPPSSAPAGCEPSYPNHFTITTVNATTASQKTKRAVAKTYTLEGGIIKDQDGNIGYIASNSQFQFANNGPLPQPGAIFTAGFSLCQNHTLALGGKALWRSCNSGSFNNLYYENTAAQCSDVFLEAIDSGSTAGSSPSSSPAAAASSSPSPSAGVSQVGDQQPQAGTSAAPSGVAQISDQQPQAPTSAAAGISQISDNQPQAPTSAATPAPSSTPVAYTGGAALATAAPMAIAVAGAFVALL